jgi:hypothetical protein
MLNFDDDQRFHQESLNTKANILVKNMFEFHLKDEFLPIYTNTSYARMFKDTSVAYDYSPKKSVRKNISGMS